MTPPLIATLGNERKKMNQWMLREVRSFFNTHFNISFKINVNRLMSFPFNFISTIFLPTIALCKTLTELRRLPKKQCSCKRNNLVSFTCNFLPLFVLTLSCFWCVFVIPLGYIFWYHHGGLFTPPAGTSSHIVEHQPPWLQAPGAGWHERATGGQLMHTHSYSHRHSLWEISCQCWKR